MNMKRLLLLFSLLSFVLSASHCFSQNTDSLWKIYRDVKNNDSVRLSAFNDIAWGLLFSNPDSAYILGHEELEIARNKRQVYWESKALNTIGASYQVKGNYIKAIDFYQQSLRIREKMNDLESVAASLANIGGIYINIGVFDKALQYQLRSLKLAEKMNNKANIASSLNNIGIVYHNTGQFEKALYYNQRSLKMYTELGDKQGIAASYANIGITYSSLHDDAKALDFQLKSLALAREAGDKHGESTSLTSIGKAYLGLKKLDLALKNALEGKKIAADLEDVPAEEEAANVLYETYKAMNNPTKALQSYERYVFLKDSIQRDDNNRKIANKEMQYEYEKKAAADSVKHSEETKVAKAQLDAQKAQIVQDRTQRWALYGGLFLLVVFGGLMYNRFRITSRQKNIIEIQNRETEEQKQIIEEKQKEILASISYAKRLQEAILPPQRMIKKHLPDSFFFYKPKDIVAGDFYWLEISKEMGDGKREMEDGRRDEKNNSASISPLRSADSGLILFAAADCTGHGVPGAMVSVVCSNALNRTVKEFGITEPGKILDKVSELVVETFEKSESEVNDGMDISLCSFNRSSMELKWSGANNPLWIIRNKALIEYKPNKQPIGKVDAPAPFATHSVQVQKDDLVYLFTDGYADQFGGEKGKKFKLSSLQELLLSIASLSMPEQMKAVDKTLKDWQGNIDQVDDILVIGIRI
jgi:serine phosphatase RsbU (regulator of sigma subunit)/tetratricopeptide (TPR) repeat protein